MSRELREIKRRIASTRQIRKVTGALQRVSAARLVRERQTVENAEAYVRRLAQLLRDLLDAAPSVEHELLNPGKGNRVGLVVFGSDRGLCGGYNAALLDELGKVLEPADEEIGLIIMGKIVNRRARRLGLPVDRTFEPSNGTDRTADLESLLTFVTDHFLTGTYREIRVLYTRFVSGLRQIPVVESVLPANATGRAAIGQSTDSGAAVEAPGRFRAATFEPDAHLLVARILPEYVRRSFTHAFLHGKASEDAARQAAMSRASENAGDMLDDLTMTYSQLRQEGITTQMIELAGGGQIA